jgi:hypothetical protein
MVIGVRYQAKDSRPLPRRTSSAVGSITGQRASSKSAAPALGS